MTATKDVTDCGLYPRVFEACKGKHSPITYADELVWILAVNTCMDEYCTSSKLTEALEDSRLMNYKGFPVVKLGWDSRSMKLKFISS